MSPLKLILKVLVYSFVIIIFNLVSIEASDWKAGVASVVITPEEPVWIGGYGSRDKPSEGQEFGFITTVM